MSVFDPILNGLLGGHVNAGPLQGVLGSILGGGTAPQSGLLAGLLGGGHQAQPSPPVQQQAPQQTAGSGGLMGLIDRFRGAGMGHVAESWVGHGPNQPVAPEQLQQVFGQDQINHWSQQTGMSQSSLLSALSQYLPQAVDRATPARQAGRPGGRIRLRRRRVQRTGHFAGSDVSDVRDTPPPCGGHPPQPGTSALMRPFARSRRWRSRAARR